MAKIVKRRRGTTAEHTVFTGAEGEITIDMDKDTLVVHDNVKPGGFPVAREDMDNVVDKVGITQLNVQDGTALQALVTDGNGNLSFDDVDPSSAPVGGDLTGTVANAQLGPNTVGITELKLQDGDSGQAIKTDGLGNIAFGDVLTDPALGGHLSGTTSAAVINNDTITTDKIIDGSVTGTKIASTTITSANMDINSIGIAQLNLSDGSTGQAITRTSGGGIAFTTIAGGGSSSSLFVENLFTGDGSTTTFTLSTAAPFEESILVFIDGVAQPTTTYTLPTTTSITITPAPGVSAAIRVCHLGIASQVGDNSISGTKISLTGESINDYMEYNGTDWEVTPNPHKVVFPASGTLPSGIPVLLQDDGTVVAVTAADATAASSFGGTTFGGNFGRFDMDPNNNDKFICMYFGGPGSTQNPSVAVGTINRTVIDVTETVTVSASKFVMDGTSQGALTWIHGKTITFDVSDASNVGHILSFSTTIDGTHGGGAAITGDLIRTGTPGTAGAIVTFVAPFAAGTLYYYCSNHPTMGGTIDNQPMFSFGTPTVFYTGYGSIMGTIEYIKSSSAGYQGRFVMAGEITASGGDPFTGTTWGGSVASSGAGTTCTVGSGVGYTSKRSGANLVATDPHHAGCYTVAFQDNFQNYRGTLAQFFLTSGTTTVVNQSSLVVQTAPTPSWGSLSYNPHTAGQGMAAYGTGAPSNCRIWTVNSSGAGIGGGSTFTVPLTGGNGVYSTWDPNPANANKLVLWGHDQPNKQIGLIVGTVASNGAVTFAAEQKWTNIDYTLTGIIWHPSNNGNFTAVGWKYDDTSSFKAIWTGSLSGNIMTMNSDREYYNTTVGGGGGGDTPVPQLEYDPTDTSNYLFCALDGSTTQGSGIGNSTGGRPYMMYGPIGSNLAVHSNLLAESFLGFSDGLYTDGQSATINVSGVEYNHTSLTVGTDYYIQLDGSLGATAAVPSVLGGKAMSATGLLIKG